LVTAIENYAQSQGMAHLYLLTTTAVDFFVGQGYRRIARDAVPAPIQATEEFRSICPDSAVCLETTL
jgi:amino-acid N-acetyltransferase